MPITFKLSVNRKVLILSSETCANHDEDVHYPSQQFIWLKLSI